MKAGRDGFQGSRTIFITGTDTGVGKTVLAGLLLQHLRQSGCRAAAMKPFCSGNRADAELLHGLQDGELSLEEINPYYFPDAVAPLVAARKRRRRIPLRDVLARVQRLRSKIEAPGPSCLLIEGAGGLLAPLGEGYSALDVIARLRCETIIVARNALGTLNHTGLTVQALRIGGFPGSRRAQTPRRRPLALKVVLMNVGKVDSSSSSNFRILSELLAPMPVISVPFLGTSPLTVAAIRAKAARLGPVLSSILQTD